MADSALVAVLAEPSQGFFDILSEIWEGGDAILPIDPRLPVDRVEEILGEFHPERFLASGEARVLKHAEPVSEEIRAVVLTSGSSGKPKGVELSLSAFTASWTSSSSRIGAELDDTWLCCLPLAHIAGLSVLVRSLLNGSRPIIQPALNLSEAEDARLISLVPTQLTRLLDEGSDLTRFKTVLVGGGRMSGSLQSRAADAGVRVVTTYGMTETCGGCVYDGIPLDEVDVRVDDNTRIGIRGEVLFSRYRSDPELTRRSVRGGWFITNDLGYIGEDSELVVMGRADDVIITGGEKVSAAEVESIISDHPDVMDCAVRGIPDAEWGELVAVAVVARAGADLSLGQLRSFMKEHAAAYKGPRRMVVVKAIPRDSMGKPIKKQVTALFSG